MFSSIHRLNLQLLLHKKCLNLEVINILNHPCFQNIKKLYKQEQNEKYNE